MSTSIKPKEVYPSIDELMPSSILARIPVMLAHEIETRYETLGEKYMTDNRYQDGRFINGCMYKSSVQDALEEIVDAVFNTLVWLFKARNQDEISDNMIQVFLGLVEIYSMLCLEREMEIAAGIQ